MSGVGVEARQRTVKAASARGRVALVWLCVLLAGCGAEEAPIDVEARLVELRGQIDSARTSGQWRRAADAAERGFALLDPALVTPRERAVWANAAGQALAEFALAHADDSNARSWAARARTWLAEVHALDALDTTHEATLDRLDAAGLLGPRASPDELADELADEHTDEADDDPAGGVPDEGR